MSWQARTDPASMPGSKRSRSMPLAKPPAGQPATGFPRVRGGSRGHRTLARVNIPVVINVAVITINDDHRHIDRECPRLRAVLAAARAARELARSEPAFAFGDLDRLGPVAGTELLDRGGQVVADRALGQVQRRGQIGDRGMPARGGQYLGLPGG